MGALVHGHQTGGGVQQHRITNVAVRATEDVAHNPRVVLGVLTPEILNSCPRHVEIQRFKRVLRDLAVTNFPHVRRRRDGQFVQAVPATENQRAIATILEDTGHQGCKGGIGHADRGCLDLGRIGDRPQKIESGGHPECLARDRGETHGGVERLRKEERDTHL